MTALALPNDGDEFLGHWHIDSQVGKGGFSVVYRAFDPEGRIAAIKILLPEDEASPSKLSYDGELADRFLREARVLEQLDNPYIIRLWDYGQSPDGLLYMVFEFIDGRSLYDEIKDQGKMSGARVLHVLRQTLIGLEAAHEHEILHRDIKPNNIMLFNRDGDADRVKLVDFGIAKMYGEASAAPGNDLTGAGLLVGTPRYMPPEQLRGTELGPHSDIYSLGLCAIEMLSGRKCIPSKDRLKVIEMQLLPQPIAIPMDVDASPGLRQVVERMLRKKVDERYQSATDALRDLEALAGDPGATGDTVFERVPASLEIPDPTRAQADEDTALHRVNASELDSLIANTPSPNAPLGHGDVTMQAAMDPTVQGPVGDPQAMQSGEYSHTPQSAHSGSHARPHPDQSYGSGNFPQPTAPPSYPVNPDQSYGSGEHPRPAQPGYPHPNRSHGSGEHPRPQQAFGNPAQPPQGFGTGERPMPTMPADPNNALQGPEATEVASTANTLSSEEKMALVAALVIPGVGHLLLGQTVKGIVILAVLLISLGLAWFLLAPAGAIDAFLVIRAKKRRDVGPYEVFPDYQDLL